MEKNNNNQEIQIKNLCPMLAMISAGKTSFLKVIFDIDFLESSSGIGTKFVNIIRYNPDVGKSPKFYHLILRNKEDGDYEFYKDENSEIIGKNEILEKNKQLNDEFKNKEVPYEDIFYMVEVGEANFIDKEYLKNYDLVDIPGVSECCKSENNQNNVFIRQKFSSTEEEMKDYKPEEEKTYLTEIFKIIKNKINNGIILFSIDNYQHAENYRIIGKFQKVINKPIENFLILLNKIDQSENREFDLNNLYSKITEYFPSLKEFNFTKNIIVPCSTLQLQNELKMDKSFFHLIYFHYLNFLMNTKQQINKNKNLNFKDFIIKFINKKKISKKNFIDKINKIINDLNNLKGVLDEITEIFENIKKNHLADKDINLGFREDDFTENEIKNLKENLEEEEEFNIDELEGNIIILYYYSVFKDKKLIPQRSRDTLKIMKYFTMENINSNIIEERKIKNIKNEQKMLNEQIIISEKMNQIYTEFTNEENLQKYKNYLFLPSNILNTSNLIYIPLLGVSNAGKSTILNGLIGYSILPAKKTECTKKGILIRYWENDYPAIRKTRFINKNNISFFQSEKEVIATKIEDIQNVLNGLNGKFTDNKEDFFYEIDIKIKFVHDSEMEDSLKERICFIDLPGFGTNNNFESLDIYSDLINSCDIFMYVVFNLKIKENINYVMLNNLYKKLYENKKISSKEFIQKCLFIINCDKDQDTSKKSLLQAKNDIMQIIPDLNNDNINDLNICFFNAKYYENYIYKYNYYNSFEFLLEQEYFKYLKLFEQLNKGQIDKMKGDSFNKFLMGQLKENIKEDIEDKYNEKEIKLNKEIKGEINKEIEKYQFVFKEKDIDSIVKYITFSRNNLCKSVLLDKSNIELIKMYLIISLKNKKTKEDIFINNKIDKISNQMYDFYEEKKEQGLNKNNLDKLKLYLKSSIGLLKSSKLFYIPILGLEKAGKSMILNCLIGNSYIPRGDKCTKKGILIKYWNKDYSVIRKNRFKKQNNIFYFEPEEEIIAKGFEDIRIVLEGTDDKYTKKEEEFFYEIDIKLKFIHDLKLDNNLKEKICFIEFPKSLDIANYNVLSFDIENENKIIEEKKLIDEKENKIIVEKEKKIIDEKENKLIIEKENKIIDGKENKIIVRNQNKTQMKYKKENKITVDHKNKIKDENENKIIEENENKIKEVKENEVKDIDENVHIFEDLYYHLIGSCNIFLYVFYKYKKNENKNKKTLKYLYNQMLEYRGISIQDFMNKILFIVNYDETDYISKTQTIEYTQTKLDIYKMIKSLDNKIIKNLNICFFNAKFYETYLFKLKYYGSPDFFINYEYNKFLKIQKKIIKKIHHKHFNKYLIEKLKKTIKIDIPDEFIEKEEKLNEEFIDSMKKTLKTKIISFSQKEFNLLVKYLSFGKKNIYKSHFLLKSKIDEFIKSLFTFILKTKRIEDEQINNNLKKCFEIFDKAIFKDNNMKIENEKKEEEFEEEESEEYEKEEIIQYNNTKYKKLWIEINEIFIKNK